MKYETKKGVAHKMPFFISIAIKDLDTVALINEYFYIFLKIVCMYVYMYTCRNLTDY